MHTCNNDHVPFPKSCSIIRDQLASSGLDRPQDLQFGDHADKPSIDHIPGDPGTKLSDDVPAHVARDLDTPLLHELYSNLWLVARKSSSNIDALHMQHVKGRAIVPTEDPRLHLIWRQGRVFVKPVPPYLLHYDFWATYLHDIASESSRFNERQPLQPDAALSNRRLALGFMRSYAFLVPHRLDFQLAREAHLIPSEVKDWEHWSALICHFRHVPDNVVAKRYHFGQLRLSRLDWAVRIYQPRNAGSVWFYENAYWSITDFFHQATTPFLFVFASVSLALSSMQVMLSIEPGDVGSVDSRRAASWAFWVFSIAVLLSWAIVWTLIMGVPLVIIIIQGLWGFRMERRRRRAVREAHNAGSVDLGP